MALSGGDYFEDVRFFELFEQEWPLCFLFSHTRGVRKKFSLMCLA